MSPGWWGRRLDGWCYDCPDHEACSNGWPCDTVRREAFPADPPVNVRVVEPDGTELPVELTYEGWVDGAHLWVATPTSPSIRPGSHLKADAVPGHTALALNLGLR